MDQKNRQPFGAIRGGEQAEILTLDNGQLSCRVVTCGAAVQSLTVPDRDGRPVDVVLGYDSLEEYLKRDGFLGAVVGRYANRIAGGVFTLDGETYHLACNDGPNHLHGGPRGYFARSWSVEELTPSRAVLVLDSPDGDEGYPGHLVLRTVYTLKENSLEICFEAETDRATPVNPASHCYFNLSGHSSGTAMDETVQLFAGSYTPTDETGIPTGEIASVSGTPMDLRGPVKLQDRIGADFPQLRQANGFDHNYVLGGTAGEMRPAARAWSEKTGILMEAETTEPGMQFYTANSLTTRKGKGGAQYGPRCAFCMETQHYPDSPNHPAFPSCILREGEHLEERTRFRFRRLP